MSLKTYPKRKPKEPHAEPGDMDPTLKPLPIPKPEPSPTPNPLAATVLVCGNKNSPQSVALAQSYLLRRGIPESNLLLLDWKPEETADMCTRAEYDNLIFNPIQQAVNRIGRADYIVLCRNLPLKVNHVPNFDPANYQQHPVSVSSMLALGRWDFYKQHYYYGGNPQPFKSGSFGGLKHIVFTLDGWSWDDANALIERGQATVEKSNLVFLDRDPSWASQSGYNSYNLLMGYAATDLRGKGVNVVCEETGTYTVPEQPVAMYHTWGSNDRNYSLAKYQSVRFLPGAVVETLVSTSASHLRYPGGWQSQVAQLIRNGATAGKGYVTEPYLQATARPNIYMKMLTEGRNVGESLYSASPYTGWKDVYLGDPLCTPYAG